MVEHDLIAEQYSRQLIKMGESLVIKYEGNIKYT